MKKVILILALAVMACSANAQTTTPGGTAGTVGATGPTGTTTFKLVPTPGDQITFAPTNNFQLPPTPAPVIYVQMPQTQQPAQPTETGFRTWDMVVAGFMGFMFLFVIFALMLFKRALKNRQDDRNDERHHDDHKEGNEDKKVMLFSFLLYFLEEIEGVKQKLEKKEDKK